MAIFRRVELGPVWRQRIAYAIGIAACLNIGVYLIQESYTTETEEYVLESYGEATGREQWVHTENDANAMFVFGVLWLGFAGLITAGMIWRPKP